MRRRLADGIELDDDPARVDREEVHRFLSAEAYWAEGRLRERQEELLDASDRVVGLYAGPTQIGFARAVYSDAAGYAYLADVYVLDAYRGRGPGLELARETIEGSPWASSRWILHTRDMHSLYAKLGFGPNERLLERPPAQ